MTAQPEDCKRNADDARRDSRYRLRAWLWEAPRADSFRIRLTSCGRVAVAGYVSVRGGGGTASLGGVSTCGSVWVCPVCSPKVAGQRSLEVQDTIRAWQATGGSVVLLTLTLSHNASDALADTWDALGKGWAAVRNGNGWKNDVKAYGIGGYVRIVEVTHSRKNGWHPHAHVLLFVAGKPSKQECEALRARLFERWSNRLGKLGYRTLDFDRDGKAIGVDVRVADAATVEYLAEYLSKFGYNPRSSATALALEATRGDLKKGRKGSRTPWELAELARDGEPWALARWQEWERSSLGRRQYAWSQGFRESLDLAGVLSDAEAVEREDLHLSTMALLPAPTWKRLVADLRSKSRAGGTPLLSRLLSVAALGDAHDVLLWCHDNDVEAVAVADETPVGLGSVAGVFAHPHEVAARRREARTRDRQRHEAAAWAQADDRAVGSHYC